MHGHTTSSLDCCSVEQWTCLYPIHALAHPHTKYQAKLLRECNFLLLSFSLFIQFSDVKFSSFFHKNVFIKYSGKQICNCFSLIATPNRHPHRAVSNFFVAIRGGCERRRTIVIVGLGARFVVLSTNKGHENEDAYHARERI